jgi:hypothetical protein
MELSAPAKQLRLAIPFRVLGKIWGMIFLGDA